MKSIGRMPLIGALALIATLVGCGDGSMPGNTGGGGGGGTGAGGGGGSSGGKAVSLSLSAGGKTLVAGDTVWVRDTDVTPITAEAKDAKGDAASMATLSWGDDGSGVVSVKPGVPTADVTGMKNLCVAGTMPKDPRGKVTATMDGMTADASIAVAFNMQRSWDFTRNCGGAVSVMTLEVTSQPDAIIEAATLVNGSIRSTFKGSVKDGQLGLEYTNPTDSSKTTITGTVGCDKTTIKGKFNHGVDCDFVMQPSP